MNCNDIVAKLREKGAPAEVISWIEEFNNNLDSKTPEGAFNSLVMIGVEVDGDCDCENNWGAKSLATEPLPIWLHNNHALYNSAVWALIKSRPGMMSKLRRVLRADLASPDQDLSEEGEKPKMYGKFVLKSYGKELDTSFLKPKPNPKWVNHLFTDK